MESTPQEALAGTTGALSFDPFYKSLSWSDYMVALGIHDVNVIQQIQPDFLSIITEPDTEATNGYQPTEDSPAGALQLLQSLLGTIQAAVPTTEVRVGAGAGSWIPSFTTYIQEFAAEPLDYVDIHVYAINDNYFLNVLTAMGIIQAAGLPTAVSESWPEKIADSELGILNDITSVDSRYVFSFWAPIDTAFNAAMVSCAQFGRFLFMSPSFTTYFADYLDYTTYGSYAPSALLPIAFDAASSANRLGTITSTGVRYSVAIVGTDTIPPTAPGTPIASDVGYNSASISWPPSTDNSGVAGYYLLRDGVQVGSINAPPYQDSKLQPSTTYTYSIKAFDVQGNVSTASQNLAVTTFGHFRW